MREVTYASAVCLCSYHSRFTQLLLMLMFMHMLMLMSQCKPGFTGHLHDGVFTLSIFWTDQSKGERHRQAIQPLLKHQPMKYRMLNQGLTTTPGTPRPTLFDKCVGSLTSPANHVTLKMQETGPTVFSPCSRRFYSQYQNAVSGLNCQTNFSNCLFIPKREDKVE